MIKIKAFDKSINRKTFHCTSEPLNHYFQKTVSQDVKRKLSSCFVAENEQGEIVGFYTLAATGSGVSFCKILFLPYRVVIAFKKSCFQESVAIKCAPFGSLVLNFTIYHWKSLLVKVNNLSINLLCKTFNICMRMLKSFHILYAYKFTPNTFILRQFM